MTRTRGGEFNCQSVPVSVIFSDESVLDDDVLGLEGRNEVPFVLPRNTEVTVEEVKARLAEGS